MRKLSRELGGATKALLSEIMYVRAPEVFLH
jgi:hypothetical protein